MVEPTHLLWRNNLFFPGPSAHWAMPTDCRKANQPHSPSKCSHISKQLISLYRWPICIYAFPEESMKYHSLLSCSEDSISFHFQLQKNKIAPFRKLKDISTLNGNRGWHRLQISSSHDLSYKNCFEVSGYKVKIIRLAEKNKIKLLVFISLPLGCSI